MRSTLLACAALIVVSCSASPRQRIVGNWTVDASRTQIPKTPLPQIEQQAKSLMGSTSVKFSADGTAVLSGLMIVEGKWTYEEGKVTLVPNDSKLLGHTPIGQRTIRFTVDPDFETLTWQPDTPFGKATLVLNKTG